MHIRTKQYFNKGKIIIGAEITMSRYKHTYTYIYILNSILCLK